MHTNWSFNCDHLTTVLVQDAQQQNLQEQKDANLLCRVVWSSPLQTDICRDVFQYKKTAKLVDMLFTIPRASWHLCVYGSYLHKHTHTYIHTYIHTHMHSIDPWESPDNRMWNMSLTYKPIKILQWRIHLNSHTVSNTYHLYMWKIHPPSKRSVHLGTFLRLF